MAGQVQNIAAVRVPEGEGVKNEAGHPPRLAFISFHADGTEQH
jgi:hypothetical protein